MFCIRNRYCWKLMQLNRARLSRVFLCLCQILANYFDSQFNLRIWRSQVPMPMSWWCAMGRCSRRNKSNRFSLNRWFLPLIDWSRRFIILYYSSFRKLLFALIPQVRTNRETNRSTMMIKIIINTFATKAFRNIPLQFIIIVLFLHFYWYHIYFQSTLYKIRLKVISVLHCVTYRFRHRSEMYDSDK